MLLKRLRDWFGDWLRKEEPQPIQTRLTRDEALAIARRAAPDEADYLVRVTVDNQSGPVIWSVSTATVGSWLQVRVDDSTGAVLDVRNVGVR